MRTHATARADTFSKLGARYVLHLIRICSHAPGTGWCQTISLIMWPNQIALLAHPLPSLSDVQNLSKRQRSSCNIDRTTPLTTGCVLAWRTNIFQRRLHSKCEQTRTERSEKSVGLAPPAIRKSRSRQSSPRNIM